MFMRDLSTFIVIMSFTAVFVLAVLMVPAVLPGINPFSAEVEANGACYTPRTPEEEGDSRVIHVPIRDIATMNMIRLSDLAEVYGWQFEQEDQLITVTSCPQSEAAEAVNGETGEAENEAGSEQENEAEVSVDFQLGELEFAGREIFQAPLQDEGEIYVGPELARLLVRDLVGDELKFITWLESDSTFYRSGDEVVVDMEIWNVSGQEQTLNFSDGQIYDIMIMNNGWVEWRWSDGRAFTMALQSKQLDPNEKLSWQESFILDAGLTSGEYQLAGKLVNRGEFPFNSVDIEIRQM